MASLDMSVDCHKKWSRLSVLSDIQSNYESIFSWNIHEKTNVVRDKKTVVFEKVTRKLKCSFDTTNVFDLHNMCLRLINCFEIFLNGDFSEAIFVIKSLIQTLKNTEMDEFFKSISDVCFHVLKATRAYIMAFLDEDVQKTLTSIKPVSTFNIVEKAAICAIKSKIFLEYPPEGNNIALDLAKTARTLNGAEMYWKSIWLKAQGRKRKFDNKYSLVFEDELELADILSRGNNPEIILRTAKIFLEAGFSFRTLSNEESLSLRYYGKVIDLVAKVYMLAPDNVKILCRCLSMLSDVPMHLLVFKKNLIREIATKIPCNSHNYKMNEALGKLYLLMLKNYTEAKKYFVKAHRSKIFSSSMYLLRIESKLNLEFSVVLYLNNLLKIYDSPKKKLIIISQILLYYVYIYCENNREEYLLHYLDKYLNVDINDAYKKYYIHLVNPFFDYPPNLKPPKFCGVLKAIINEFKKHAHWSFENKKTLESVISKFSTLCDQDSKEKEDVDMDFTCVVCLEENKAYIIFEPCYHKCVCERCWRVLCINNKQMCPLCRSHVTCTSIFKKI